MSIQVKFRRGTSTQHNSFTGANGEITVDTTNKTLRVHDGVTVGGIRLAKLSEASGNNSSYLQVANAAALYATKAYAASNTAVRSLISDRLQVANAAASFKVIAEASAELANTNAYIATKANWSSLTGTNTALRTLISDRLQVSNANAKFATKAYAASNTYLNTNFLNKTMDGGASQTIQSNIQFSANVYIQGKLEVTGGITSYYANNVSTGDNMIYLNANSIVSNPDLGLAGNYNDGTYHHAGFFRDASDSGTWKVFENYALEPDASPYINTSHASFRLAPFSARDARFTGVLSVTANTTLGNTSVSGFLKLNGTDIRSTFAQNTYVKSILANTNLYIGTKANWSALTGTNTALRTLISDRLQVANARSYMQVANTKVYLANTNAYIATKVNTSTFNLALANTNAYINSVVVSGGATWSALLATNTALRTLISDRYQVANVNTLLAAKATWTALTGTNTAIRALVSDRLQVANAVSTYATKSNPVTSGLIQHTGRMTISTNLDVSGNTHIYKLKANGSLGTAGYALKTNGTSVYWDAVGTAGGATWAALTSTNTALRLLIDDRMQVANTKAYLANTNAFIKSQLANTNAYIATKVDTTTFNLALANTNAYINSVVVSGGATWSALSSTNTALRLLINDRMQVANTNTLVNGRATWTALTGTNTALRALISDRMQVANTNALISARATWSSLTGTNTALRLLIDDKMQVSNTNTLVNGRATWSALTGTNTALRTLISDRYQVANVNTLLAAKATWAGLTGTNTALRTLISDRYQVANVNTLLAAKATWSALTGTNTALRTLISDRYQVANVNSNFLKKTGTVAQTITPDVNFSANVSITGRLTVTGGITSYYANNVSTGDNMIYLNANSTVSNPDLGFAGNYNDGTYHHAGFFRDASDAGTFKVFENYGLEPDASPYIDTTHASFKLAPFAARDARFTGILSVTANTTVGNTTVGGFLKLNGTDIRATFAQNTYVKSTLANTNLRINLINTNLTGTNTALRTLISDRLQVANARSYMQVANVKSILANTNSYIATKVDTTTFNLALANTNAYIASVVSGGGGVPWSALTSTNTALRLLIDDRMQVSNTNTLVNGRATWSSLTGTNTALRTLISDRYQVANVNTLLAAKATWSALTGTNTALRTLISDRLQVANAATVYQTKAIERAALANTNLRINLINTNLTGTNTALRTLISDRLQVANAATTYLTKNNPVITGTLTANGTSGTAGYYLRSSGTGIYWSPVAAGGGGGGTSNSFHRITVGANTIIATSSQDILTLVAGSGINLAANPATDTITLSTTGGFSGGTVTGVTVFTNTTDSTNDTTGAVEIAGGLGVTKNIYTAAKIGYSSSSTSVAYTYYNSTTSSLDTVFG